MKQSTSKQFIKNIGVCAFAFSGFQLSASAETPLKMNIIFILTDDQRWDAIGAMGNSIIKTHNMNRLANTGVLFQN